MLTNRSPAAAISPDPAPAAARLSSTLDAARIPATTRPRRRRLVGAAIGTLAVAVAVTTVTVVLRPAEQPDVVPSVATQPAVDTQAFLQRLADQGYIPAASVDRERLLLERLVNQGQIPAASVEPLRRVIGPLSTAEDRALLDAVRSGQVPADALDAEALQLERPHGGGPTP